jgi:hypothetical protein
MQKRKSPVLLITAVVLLAGAVGFMNLGIGGNKGADGHNHAAENPNEAVGEKRDTVSKEVLASSNTPKKESGEAPMAKTPRTNIGPSIKVPKMSDNAPKPNDSTVRGRWYDSESYDQTRKEDR